MAEQEQTASEAPKGEDQVAQSAPTAAASEAPVAAPATGAAHPTGGRDQRGGSGGSGGGRGGRGGRGGPHGGGGGRGGRGGRGERRADVDASGVESSLVRIYKCSKVIKGGRSFSFGALVVAGDRKGNLGFGYGKANEVPLAVEKATKDARKNMFRVNLKGTTIPHTVRGVEGASSVVLVPARPGTGVTAGKSVRPCLELAGITDILSKAYGSTSPKNIVKATMAALKQLQSKEQVERGRGVTLAAGAGELEGVAKVMKASTAPVAEAPKATEVPTPSAE
jgi:small subunit ribosomal protein S5